MKLLYFDGQVEEALTTAVKDECVFKHGWNSNGKKGPDQGHWNFPLTPETKTSKLEKKAAASLYDASTAPFFQSTAAFSCWEIAKKLFGERRLTRGYVNGYTFGTDAYIHKDITYTDDFSPEHGFNGETIMFYLNSSWDPNFAGETVWLDKEGDIFKSLLPKQGRVVCFDASILHGARPLSRFFYGLRQVLVFKTMVDQYPEKAAVEFIFKLTENVPHSQTTLFDHLYGTFYILKQLQQPRIVCFAALFHSVYNTEFFKANLNITREQVVSIIGKQAENLVYEFCTIRPRKEYILSDGANAKQLAAIEYANLIEQNQRKPVNMLYVNQLKDIMENK